MNVEKVENNFIYEKLNPKFIKYKEVIVSKINANVNKKISEARWFSPWAIMNSSGELAIFGKRTLSSMKVSKEKISIDEDILPESVCYIISKMSKFSEEISDAVMQNKHMASYFKEINYNRNNYIRAFQDNVKSDLFDILKMSLSESDFFKVIDTHIENFKPNDSFVLNVILAEGISPKISYMSKILLAYKDEKTIDDHTVFRLLSNVSVKTLLEFKNHKDKKVRRLVYERLGVEDHLEDMMKDKDKDIRVQALMFCPKDHPFLEKMVNDRSKYVLQYVIDKMSKEKCIFLLGNSKVQSNPWLMKKLNEKINS